MCVEKVVWQSTHSPYSVATSKGVDSPIVTLVLVKFQPISVVPVMIRSISDKRL